MKKAAGLIYGPDAHHLDHLAVVCKLMHIPLIVTEEEIAALGIKYYPNLQIVYWDYLEVAHLLVENFDVVFYSMPRDLFDEVFFFTQKFFRKRIHTIWCPHGNSDKGNASYFMEALHKEEAALVYGKKMVEFLIRKHVFEQLKAHVVTGNFRYQFYLQHQEFFDRIVQKEVRSKLTLENQTILYAPTWQDSENSSSFFSACPLLLSKVPQHYNLIVKLHPNLLLKEEEKIQNMIDDYEDHENILFLKEFPLVYPLLACCDIYLGDMSSIGYDFLTFDRPMFFLNENSRDFKKDLGLYLFRCGIEIKPHQYENIFTMIDDYLNSSTDLFSPIRKEVYAYTFAKEKPWDELREEIQNIYDAFSDDELDYLI